MTDTAAQRCQVMGVVNVTPDSFSDGGRWLDPQAAIAQGLELLRQGADIIDVGGESTRPGALRVDEQEETARVVPVVKGLVAEGAVVSVDTMRSAVAEQAIEAGATLVNDVSGGRADQDMFSVVAQARIPFVVMHWRGHSINMQERTRYDDVVADVVNELHEQVDLALRSGIAHEDIIVDPGLGFAKTGEQNWTVLNSLDAFHELGHRVLVAASRKRFLGELLGDGGELRDVNDREDATVAITTLAAFHGAWAVRVHNVRPSRDATEVVARWHRG